MPKQKVGKGETAISLSKKKGFDWNTVWNHGENAELKAKRKDPSLLFETDEIFFPEKQLKEVSKSTDAEHIFKRKGDPCKIKLQLLKLGKPRANEDYTFNVEGTIINGKTDAEGNIEHFIPSAAKSAKLILSGGKEEYPVGIGRLDPLEEISGVQQRLNNLGHNCAESGKLDEKTKAALKKFQADNKLEATGEIDSDTKAKLQSLSK